MSSLRDIEHKREGQHMTNTANIQAQPSLGFGIEPLRAKWGWIVALGVVYLIVGVIALGSIILATAASVFLVGIMMVIAGVAEIINAFQIKTWGRFLSLFWVRFTS